MKKLISCIIFVCVAIVFFTYGNALSEENGAFGLSFGTDINELKQKYNLELFIEEDEVYDITPPKPNILFDHYEVEFLKNKLKIIRAYSKNYTKLENNKFKKDIEFLDKVLTEKYGSKNINNNWINGNITIFLKEIPESKMAAIGLDGKKFFVTYSFFTLTYYDGTELEIKKERENYLKQGL